MMFFGLGKKYNLSLNHRWQGKKYGGQGLEMDSEGNWGRNIGPCHNLAEIGFRTEIFLHFFDK